MAKPIKRNTPTEVADQVSPLGLPRASERLNSNLQLGNKFDNIPKTAYNEDLGSKGEDSTPLKEFLPDFKPDEFLRFVVQSAKPIDEKDIAEAVRKLKPEFFAAFQAAKSAEATESLPSVAPKLWTDRDKKNERSPASFIRRHYAEWIDNGLTNGLLQKLDLALYTAYRREVTKKPELIIPCLPLTTRAKQLSPEDARERQLESKRKYYHLNKGS